MRNNNNVTTKELQPEYRPDERFLTCGPGALSDAELLAIILRTGSVNENSVELARRVLSSGSKEHAISDISIMNIFRYELADLLRIRGIGKVKAIQIKAIAELAMRISRSCAGAGTHPTFDTPEKVAAYYMEQLRHQKRETVVLLMLNSACSLIREQVISTGTVNASMVSAREVFIEALRYEAVCIILLHNHPSGDPSPSEADVRITEHIRYVGTLTGIRLIDHIIIGDNQYYSFQENGRINE